jgi:HAD superfamily hydrolase (TIGR01509 family)
MCHSVQEVFSVCISLRKKARRLPIFIFDIGGVVIIWRNNDPIFKAVAKRYNVPFSKMKASMSPRLSQLESGKVSDLTYLRDCLRQVGKKMNSEDNATKILALPFERGAKSRKGVIQIIQRLKDKGYKVYAFSNTSAPHVPIMKKKGWARPLFNRLFASNEIGKLKPEKSAFQAVLRSIGAKPNEVVFIDNMPTNVIGARRAGIRNAVRFHSIASLRESIRKILSDYENDPNMMKPR